MKQRVSNNEYFLCGGDSRKGITNLYNEVYKVASKEQHENFILITSETEFNLTTANQQLKNKWFFTPLKLSMGLILIILTFHKTYLFILKV